MSKVVSLVNRRKITALESKIKELTEVTTSIKVAMQALSKHNEFSEVRHRVNDLFALYNELKASKQKKLEFLERLKNEQDQDLEG